ncbi:PDZ domain-containing protein, partial [Acinetobacter baumannii]
AAAGAQAGIAGALSAPFPRGIVGLALGATKDGTIVVSSVVPGTSAAEAGFQAGDRIVAVGDKSVQTMTLNQAVGLMRDA